MMILISLLITVLSPGFADEDKTFSKTSLYQLEQTWTNQDGKQISIKDLSGHPTVTTMIFTSCPAACPMMISDMKVFDKKLSKKERKQIRFVAFSMDPVRDTPEVLRKFMKKMRLDERWTLLTSNTDQPRELAAVLNFSYKSVGADFTHSMSLYLISAGGEILSRKERNADWTDFLEKFRLEKTKVPSSK